MATRALIPRTHMTLARFGRCGVAITMVGGAMAAASIVAPADVRACTEFSAISLSATSGPRGTDLQIRGSGFAAADVQIRWFNESGPVLTTMPGPTFSTKVTVPDAAPGTYNFLAMDGSGTRRSVAAAFTVTPSDPAQSAPPAASSGPASVMPPYGSGQTAQSIPRATSQPLPPSPTAALTTPSRVAAAAVARAPRPVGPSADAAVAAPASPQALAPSATPGGSSRGFLWGALSADLLTRNASADVPPAADQASGPLTRATMFSLALIAAAVVAATIGGLRRRGTKRRTAVRGL